MNRKVLSGILGTATLLGVLSVLAVVSTARPAGVAMTSAPSLSTPGSGSTLANMSPTLGWSLPSGATQVQVQVTPANNDGPGVNLILNATNSFVSPAPPDWYGLLPDMTYTWQVRATDATIAVGESDASWGPWSTPATFSTPKVNVSSVTAYSPVGGAEVTSAQPVLTWSSATADLYYWAVQVSKDAAFGLDNFLYWGLVHGDVIYPNNAYTIPPSFRLDAGATYFWRVRPRVQGNGTELPWTSAASFRTPAPGALSLRVQTPTDESTVSSATLSVTGQTKAGAFVTVDDQFVTANAAGDFAVTITVTEGINLIDVIASDTSGAVVSTTIMVFYVSGGATLQDGRERGPSLRDLLRVHQGEITAKGSGEFTLKDRNGRVATVLVDDKTRFHQMGKRGAVSFDDLKAGMRVAVYGLRIRPGDGTPKPVPTGSASAKPSGSATATPTAGTARGTSTAVATVAGAGAPATLSERDRKAEKDTGATFTLRVWQVVLPRVKVKFAHRIGEITAISETALSIVDRKGEAHTGVLNSDTKKLPTECLDDYQEQRVSRRKTLKLLAGITGSMSAAGLLVAACSPAPPPAPAATAVPPTATPRPANTPIPDDRKVAATDPAVKAEMVRFPNGSETIMGYLAKPAQGDGPWPAVLVCHENRGLTAHIEDVVRRFAKSGYVALGVDRLSRAGGTKAVTGDTQIPGLLTQNVAPTRHVGDFQAGLAYLNTQSFVAKEKFAMTGYCFGGGMTWLTASMTPELKAIAPHYGPTPADAKVAANIKAQVLGVYASTDPNLNARIPELEEALKEGQVTYQMKLSQTPSTPSTTIPTPTGIRRLPPRRPGPIQRPCSTRCSRASTSHSGSQEGGTHPSLPLGVRTELAVDGLGMPP